MDISRVEQRLLHLLAQGGRIEIEKNEARKAVAVKAFTRDGWRLPNVDLALFRKLKRKGAIASSGGRPYLVTRRGLLLVRSEPDNR